MRTRSRAAGDSLYRGRQNWPAFNRIYAEMFGDAKPARTVVPVPELHHGYLVEVEAIAVRRS